MTKIKDKTLTKQRILSAIHELLVTKGYAGLGINRIAKEAGVDKVLIYRYFGGFEGALKAYAETELCWPPLEEMLGCDKDSFSKMSPLEQRKSVTRNSLRAMRKRPHTLALLAWELVEANALTSILAELREKQSQEIYRLIPFDAASEDAIDARAFYFVLGSAIHYLAISELSDRNIFGLNKQRGVDWDSVEHVLDMIHDGIPQKATAETEV
ncbi:TetR family transcriptional regulator [Sinobacterium caligoides]|uniref:TetR family transcriptional regulator n=1 Tax=Sinobacterium caligoides TaxID=933926 RepID=A0A3N2DYP4_9GAMM|nr:TetR/AcrR family transcriptional regulator [Sinobacterium caligoides]ROS04639.1 TetR family transcriptional regulator [Sinobacterium caligoides]